MTSEPRLFTRTFATLMLAHALVSLGSDVLLLVPLFLDHLGASRAVVGLVLATSGVGGLLVRPIVGHALDRVGRRATIVGGTAFLVAGFALLALVRDLGPTVYIAHAAIGIGSGTLFTGYFTLAADLVPPARRTEGLALFGISGLVTLAVLPVVDLLQIEAEQLRTLFVGMGALVASSALLLLGVPGAAASAADVARPSLAVLGRRALWPVWWATVVFSTLVAVFMAFVTVSAEDRGVAAPAMVWLSYGLGAVSMRVFGARLPERVGPSRMVAPSLLCYVAGLLAAAAATTTGGFVAAGLLAGVGHGFAFPVLAGQLVARVDGERRGSAMALFTALWDLTKLLLVPAAGWLADLTDDRTMWVAFAVAATLSLLGWRALERGVEDDDAVPTRTAA